MSFLSSRLSGRRYSAYRALILAAALMAQAAWPVVAAGGEAQGSLVRRQDLATQRQTPGTKPNAAAAGAGGLDPTIHWEEVVAHEDDRIAFEPGGRVTVPFKPRRSDRWTVGGALPRALPAGRLDGTAIRGQGTAAGPTVAPSPGSEPAATDPGAISTTAPTPAPTAVPTVVPTPALTAVPTDSSSPTPPAEPPATPTFQPSSTPTVVDQRLADPADVVHAVNASTTAPTEPTTIHPAAAVDPGALRREVFGFLPYWQVNSSTLRIQYDKISTIAYFGVGADGAGNLMKRNTNGTLTTGWSGWTSSRMTTILNDAHRTGTRVVLTVQSFAWNASGATRQQALLGSSTARLNLARQIAAAVRDRGADGVNLDFEPLVSGADAQFTALVRTLRAELNKIAAGYQLTFDTTGYIGNYPIEEATAPGGADAIFIMGYDYRGSSSSPVGSVAPLSRPGYDIRDTVAAYAARVPTSKLILGVPYYGRAWSTATDLLNAKNISGTRYGASATVIYTSALPLFSEHGRRYATVEQVAWTAYRRQNCTATYGCVNPWRQLYVDDARALGAKYALVNQYGLRGAGIWALGYDGTRPELWQTVKDWFVTDTVPPTISGGTLSSSHVSPNGDGRQDTVSASVIGSGYIRWGYAIAPVVAGVVGANIRSGTVENKTVRLTWDGRAHDGSAVPDGRYRLTLWLGDVSDNRSVKAFDVIRDTVAPTVVTTASPWVITPNGDGRGDKSSLRWSSSEWASTQGRIVDRTGKVVRRWMKTGTSGGLTWDGRNQTGAWLPSGRYTYRMIAFDKAGNPKVVDRPVAIDKTIVSLTWSANPVRRGTPVTVTYRIRRTATVTLSIYRDQTLIRRVYTSRSLAAGTYSWRWDGRNASGSLVARGKYKAVISVTSWIATTGLSRSVTIE